MQGTADRGENTGNDRVQLRVQ